MTTTDISEMSQPVRCRFCGKAYDLGMVTVTQRYADCSVFQTPCCDKQADDRTWTGFPAFTKIDKDHIVDGVLYMSEDGDMYGYE